MNQTEKLPAYGGQAVMEGVLMRGKNCVAMAMRSPEKEIVVHKENLSGIYTSKLRNIPFIRGVIILWDAMGLGMRLLTISANLQTGEEEKIEGATLTFTIAISLLLGVGLFFLLPAGAAGLLEKYTTMSSWVSNIVEGLFRLIILIGYLWAIGKMPDIRRVFQYHGAEHKTINAFEDGAELTPEKVKNYSLEHPRCGTSFILTLVVISILIFSFLGPLSLPVRIASRLLMIPLVAGIAYEYIKFLANHIDNKFVKIIVKPNLWLQKLSTKEPTLEMLEVSIKAFNEMYAMDQQLNLSNEKPAG